MNVNWIEQPLITPDLMKKKIVIFSSYGGGGHISASRALQEYLEIDYDIDTVYIFDAVLWPLDPLKMLTFGLLTGEQFYNFCLRKKLTKFINFFYKSARFLYSMEKGLCIKIVHQYLQEQKPDLVISVVPLINDVLRTCCERLSIPFLLIPTDLDPDSFIYNLKKPSKNMRIAVPFNDQEMLKAFDVPGIDQEQLVVTDFPIKRSFFQKKDVALIKKEFNVPAGKKVILILMGAAGAEALYTYVKTLNDLDFSVHLLVCLGRNEHVRERIEHLQLKDSISMTIIGYTNRIADLLAIADLCITKAGTVSVCETLYMNVPMILDNMSEPLAWEAFNFDFIKKHNFGKVCDNFADLNALVKQILNNPVGYALMKDSLQKFPKKEFGYTIKELVDQLLEE